MYTQTTETPPSSSLDNVGDGKEKSNFEIFPGEGAEIGRVPEGFLEVEGRGLDEISDSHLGHGEGGW